MTCFSKLKIRTYAVLALTPSIGRGMVHPSAEVAERLPANTLTKNGSRLEVWQQGVPGERWIDCQLVTEVPVVLLPTRPECLPNEE